VLRERDGGLLCLLGGHRSVERDGERQNAEENGDGCACEGFRHDPRLGWDGPVRRARIGPGNEAGRMMVRAGSAVKCERATCRV
jgi:hypothetical protein